jgi:hypothetical protein
LAVDDRECEGAQGLDAAIAVNQLANVDDGPSISFQKYRRPWSRCRLE